MSEEMRTTDVLTKTELAETLILIIGVVALLVLPEDGTSLELFI